MEKIRTFIAIDIPTELREALGEMISELKRTPADIKWVQPEAVHLTLKFLGEITPADVQSVFTVMEKVAANHHPFELFSASKGAFPSFRRPRVLWIGINQTNRSRLVQLQREVEQGMAEIGFPEEKRSFSPHLTIGRVRNPRGIETAVQQFMEYPFPEYSIPVNALLVMKSELRREGARYSVQKSFPLEKI